MIDREELKKQLAQARAAATHVRDAIKCAEKANIDQLPDDLEALATQLDEIAEIIEQHINPPAAQVYQIRDYLPITG